MSGSGRQWMQYICMVMIGYAIVCSGRVYAIPFEACPEHAWLGQGKRPVMFDVDFIAGHYASLSHNSGTNNSLNAMGFNTYDHYIYAWSNEFDTLARMESDFSIQALDVVNKPDTVFSVGDTAVASNTHYVYQQGAEYGLYRISLDSTSSDYLMMQRVVDGQNLDLRIFDMAFHPTNGFAYAVDRQGVLWRINVVTGTADNLGDLFISGIFGAAWFDSSGGLYVSRNNDGFIFRIDTSDVLPVAQRLAIGPASNTNDGARCPLASSIDAVESQIDYGDAPDTYGTSLIRNGPRHIMTGSDLYLGDLIDGEHDAYVMPFSDDEHDINDDDGVQFLTDIEVGVDAIIEVKSSGDGYLNAWVDFNRDGVFGLDEKIIHDDPIPTGYSQHHFFVPAWAIVGDSWVRVRLSPDTGTGAYGSIQGGEVEDYPVFIHDDGITDVFLPSEKGWNVLVFEDRWPLIGDFDFNDLVVNYRITESVDQHGDIVEVFIEGEIVAVGASYHNGFSVRLPGIAPSAILQTEAVFMVNNIVQHRNLFEQGHGDTVLLIADDIWNYVSGG